MAGFGICRFILHTCSLHFLVAAPLVLRVRGWQGVWGSMGQGCKGVGPSQSPRILPSPLL